MLRGIVQTPDLPSPSNTCPGSSVNRMCLHLMNTEIAQAMVFCNGSQSRLDESRSPPEVGPEFPSRSCPQSGLHVRTPLPGWGAFYLPQRAVGKSFPCQDMFLALVTPIPAPGSPSWELCASWFFLPSDSRLDQRLGKVFSEGQDSKYFQLEGRPCLRYKQSWHK